MPKNLKLKGLNKNERLKSKKDTDLLFTKGKQIFSFPFKVVYARQDAHSQETAVQLLVSVPKRKFKKAVDRNLLRRRIKEAYRMNKNELDISSSSKPLSLAIIYTHHEIRDFNDLQKRLILILRKLNLELNPKTK